MNDSKKIFEKEYKKLNQAQKEAVDTIEGPVMVVAGPGTGKTQILALRIGNILLKTDIKADGILCLTFTNSAVEAMKARLVGYIGSAGEETSVFTFHSFGMRIIERYFEVLRLSAPPKLLDDADTAILFDEILEQNDWEYLRPRSDASRYFSDLRSLISLLKRERITSKEFSSLIEKEIESEMQDPENISTRGEFKGELKKEVLSKLEALKRSREVARFFDLYEKVKKNKNKENILLDYDDVLENLVKIVEMSPDARSDIQEKYLYVLVDEHQDSSRVQNEFLKIVWGEVESPNLFVVGDDRQLIYGFSGASIDHFQGFKKTFKDAKLITLVDNYRSTQVILDASHALLQSTMTDEKLISQSHENHSLRVFEADYPRDEIVAAAIDIQDKIRNGVKLNECAILVPKNSQVRNALRVLHEMGLAVSSIDALNLFDQEEAQALLRILKIINDPSDSSSLAFSFFDQSSRIPPIEAHKYLSQTNMREFFLDTIAEKTQTLFGDKAIQNWIRKLHKWKNYAETDYKNKNITELIEIIGKELLLEGKGENKLVASKEILNTMLALALKEMEKDPDITLGQFLSVVERLESYGEHIPVVMEDRDGVKVLTLHSSKGLEFDYVWIAHMDERSLNSGKKMGFVLPEAIRDRVEDRDTDKIKRKLYVAITRAKRFCTLSYATYSAKDSEQEIAKVIADLPEEIFSRRPKGSGPRLQTSGEKVEQRQIPELKKLVREKYKDRYISVSLLNNFFECPWKWYFRNLLQLPEPTAEILEFGTLVHASIDKILSAKGEKMIPTVAEINVIINAEVLNIGFKNERTNVRMSKEAREIIVPWVKKRLPQIKLSRKTEEGISVKDDRFPHLKIFGKIDLIENLPARHADASHAGGNKEEVRVTDFKTGRAVRKSEIEKFDEEGRMGNLLRQLAMYSYLLESNTKWKGVIVRESRLEFLESKSDKDAIYDRVVTQSEINLLIKDIEEYDKLVRSGEWTNRPCNYNSYGRNTECEYCALAEIYK